jgi:hypothetical protein
MSLRNTRSFAVAALTLAGLAASANAGITGSIITIEAKSSLGVASFEFITNSDFQNGVLVDGLSDSIELTTEDGTVIANITNLNVMFIADPVVNMNFSVFAGAVDTVFTITSGLLTFSPLNNPDARASGGVTVTDSNGNGAWATGGFDDAKFFRSFYNGANPGEGTQYSSLINGVTVPDGFGSDDSSEESAAGFTTIPGAVTSMTTQFSFTASAFDQVSGTSTFVVVPSPAAIALASIGGLAMIRRKR